MKKLVKTVNDNEKFDHFKIALHSYDWYGISKTINAFKYDDKEEYNRIIEGFSKFWAVLGKDFLNEKLNIEYNNIKHGFRIEHGGFGLSIGREDKPGQPTRPDKMIPLGGSKYGSTIQKVEILEGSPKKCNVFTLRRTRFNWDIELFLARLELLTYSLINLISFTIGISKGRIENQIFEVPDDLDLFNKVLVPKVGVTTFDMDYPIYFNQAPKLTNEDIKKFYDEKIIFFEKENP